MSLRRCIERLRLRDLARPAKRAVVCLSVVLITACFDVELADKAIVKRFIEDDPQALLAREELFEVETVFDWQLDSEKDLEPWRARQLKISWQPGGRLHLRPSGEDPHLVRSVQLSSAEVHTVEVTLSGLTGEVELFWAADGQPFSPERRLARRLAPRERGKRTTVTFDLARKKSWNGAIGRLRLDPTTAARDTIQLESIRGLRRTVSKQPAAGLRRSWKFQFGSDVRNALLAVPGQTIVREIEIVPHQALEFSYGVESSLGVPVTFRVVAQRDQALPEALFEETLDPDQLGGRWHEASIPLDAYAGDRLKLSLETVARRPLDLARGFPVWANPQILGPGGEDLRPNVVLISIDTLKASHLSAYGYPYKTSPNIDAWAAESAVRFQNAVVQAPWTLPSHASLFSGLDAMRHGVNHSSTVPAALEMLPETLRRAGYATAAITGGGYFRPQFGFAQGYDTYRFWRKIGSDEELAHNIEKLLAWLEANRSRRFFLFFHTYEVHDPHRERQPYLNRLRGQEPAIDSRGEIFTKPGHFMTKHPRWVSSHFAVKQPDGTVVKDLTEPEKVLVRRMYDSAIAYTDDQLGRVLNHLDKLGLRDKTVVVLTSDHGESLGEDDRAGHDYLDDNIVLVPLIMEFPDARGAGEVVAEQVRSIDVTPTILDYLGLDPGRQMDGVSLLPAIGGDVSTLPAEAYMYAAFNNYGFGLRYRNRLKYILDNTAWSETVAVDRLYDLQREPRENRSLDADDGRMERFRQLARRTMAAQHTGLRMQIRNHGQGRLVGRLRGAWAAFAKVKVLDSSCRCLSWTKGRKAELSLSPGQEVTLLFETIAGGRLGLEGAFVTPAGRRESFKEELAPQELHDSLTLAYSSSGWRLSPSAGGEVEVGFRIWWAGGRGGEVDLPEIDSETRDQLRALGYLE